MAVTYALGNWTVSNSQDKALKRIFNKNNRERAKLATISAPGSGYAVNNVLTLVEGTFTAPATYIITSVSPSGGVTGVALVETSVNAGGIYTAHPSQNTHTTTVTPSGGTGCTLNIQFFQDVPGLVVNNGGILDGAVTSWTVQQNTEIQAALGTAIATASDVAIANAASALSVTLPA